MYRKWVCQLDGRLMNQRVCFSKGEEETIAATATSNNLPFDCKKIINPSSTTANTTTTTTTTEYIINSNSECRIKTDQNGIKKLVFSEAKTFDCIVCIELQPYDKCSYVWVDSSKNNDDTPQHPPFHSVSHHNGRTPYRFNPSVLFPDFDLFDKLSMEPSINNPQEDENPFNSLLSDEWKKQKLENYIKNKREYNKRTAIISGPAIPSDAFITSYYRTRDENDSTSFYIRWDSFSMPEFWLQVIYQETQIRFRQQ